MGACFINKFDVESGKIKFHKDKIPYSFYDFNVVDIYGKNVQMSDYRRFVLVIFIMGRKSKHVD